MEPLIVLADRNVVFHGIWVAGFRVTDKLLKSIGVDLGSKPSRPCKLLLTSAGLTLEVLPSSDGKTGKTDQVAFHDLRDVIINPYNTKCLMVIYVDSKTSNFSIMACSSQEERHLSAICGAYKDRKNFLLQTQQNRSSGQAPLNWTLRQRHRPSMDAHPPLPNFNEAPYVNGTKTFQVGSPRILNGIVAPTGVTTNGGAAFSYRHFSDGSDNLEDEAFLEEAAVQVHRENEVLEREPVDGSQAYNVGVQTLHTGDESDTESIRSSSSFRSLRDDIYTLSEEMKAIKFLLETSTGISAEEYYRRRDIQGNRHAVAFHSVPKMKVMGGQEKNNTETDGDEQQTNGGENGTNESDNNNNDNANGDEDDYDLRSIAAQTDSSKMNQRRYLRRPMNAITANANKEKVAAVRKRSANNSVTSPGPGSPNSFGGGSSSGGSGSFSDVPRSPSGHSQRSSVSGFSYQGSSVAPSLKGTTKPLKKPPIPTTSSTVVRSIESVYQGRKPRRTASATGHGSQRKRIVFMAPAKTT